MGFFVSAHRNSGAGKSGIIFLRLRKFSVNNVLHQQLQTLQDLLQKRLRSDAELLQAAQICRSMAGSELRGAHAFYLFALYLEQLLQRSSLGPALSAEWYEAMISSTIPLMEECLSSICEFDADELTLRLDSFARQVIGLGERD
jgi:hypothetical protein